MSLQGKGKGMPRVANPRTKFPVKCTLNPATKFKGHAHSARQLELRRIPYGQVRSCEIARLILFTVLNTKYG